MLRAVEAWLIITSAPDVRKRPLVGNPVEERIDGSDGDGLI